MKREELSAEDQKLLNTQFSPELEKEAAEQVKVAQELYTTGFSKLAAETADELDKLAEESAKEEGKEGEGEGEKKPELDEEQKKEAAARGAFIAQGFIDGLKKLGSERHGDEMAYLYPFINEKLAFMGKALKMVSDAGKHVANTAGRAAAANISKGTAMGKAMGHAQAAVGKAGKMVAEHPGKAMGAAAGAAGAGAGLAALKMMGRKDKK